MNFFDHKDLGNHLLRLCPKVVKHPVYIHNSPFYTSVTQPDDGYFKYPKHVVAVTVTRKKLCIEGLYFFRYVLYKHSGGTTP